MAMSYSHSRILGSVEFPVGPPAPQVAKPDLVSDPLLDQFDLGYLWKKYRKRALLLPLIGGALGLGVALLQEPLYESTALLLVDPDYERMVRYEPTDGAAGSQLESLKSMEIAIATDSVVSRAIKRLDLRAEAGFLPSHLTGPDVPEPKILKFLRKKRISSSLVPETRLIRIRVLDPSPERAKRLADTLTEEFESYLREQRREEFEKAREELAAQADGARLVALESDKRLDEFRRGHPRFPVEQDHELFSARLSQFGEQLNAATGARLQLESQKAALAELDPETAALEIVKVAGYNDLAHVSALLDKLSVARADLSAAQEQFTPDHPTHRVLAAKVARHTAELVELARGIQAAIDASYLAEKSRETTLAKELDSAKTEFTEMKSLSSEFRALQQQSERDWSVHEAFQSKLSESAVAVEMKGQIARMVSEPMVPYETAKPVVPLFVIVGGAGGAALAFGGILLAVLSGLPYSNNRQIEQRLGLPVIADWSASTKPSLPLGSPELLEYLGGDSSRAIHITAPERDGIDEAVAHDLAVAAAKNGRRTLLISIKTGSVGDQIRAGELDRLHRVDLDIESVRNSDRFLMGLEKMKTRFDCIFIEAPGLEDRDLVDYLSRLADQTILVVSKGKTRKRVVEDRIVRCSRPGSPPVALILVNPC